MSSEMFVLMIAIMTAIVSAADVAPQTIPFEKINLRPNEFRRLDSDGDKQITFTEFILGDRHYSERKSAAFYKLDENGDGVVSRGEYDSYYKKANEVRRRSEIERDRFFERMVNWDSVSIFSLPVIPVDASMMIAPIEEKYGLEEKCLKNSLMMDNRCLRIQWPHAITVLRNIPSASFTQLSLCQGQFLSFIILAE